MNNTVRTFRHAHLACGIGAGARGFNLANPRIGNVRARFECAGGIDVDAAAIANFEKMTGAKGTVMDLFNREQFIAFHHKEPPADWREAVPEDIYRAFGGPVDVVFASMPCKGFSGLLSQKKSESDRYQALNGLTLRGVWLMLEAYKNSPVPVVLFENVPRIANRGRWLLDQIVALLRHYGYQVAETVHDCGELGGLAQSRKRFLLIARHSALVPPFVYQPAKKQLRGVGEVIGKLPLPADPVAGPMHRVPSLQWQTWVRLALVPAGRDWRALNELRVEDGVLADYGIVPAGGMRDNALGVCSWDDTAPLITGARSPGQGRFAVADPRPTHGPNAHQNKHRVVGYDDPSPVVTGSDRVGSGALSVADPRTPELNNDALGVRGWDDSARVVATRAGPTNGAHSVADPRVDGHPRSVQLGVRPWNEPAPCVKGDMPPGGGPYAVSDPRIEGRTPHSNVFRIVPFDQPGKAVTSAHSSGQCVADPRPAASDYNSRKYRVTPYDGPSRTVIGASTTGDGAFAVADPRGPNVPDLEQRGRPYGKYPVAGWEEHAPAVIAGRDQGAFAVADPREFEPEGMALGLPEPKERLVCRIVSTDDCWHRPFTTLELASLQSLFDPEEAFEETADGWKMRSGFGLESTSDSTRREWIGNAVPSDAAKAMAETIGETLLLAGMGETFTLSTQQIWVKPLALALAVNHDQPALRLDGSLA